jgi:apolipoprotein D and lipocalin family protein
LILGLALAGGVQSAEPPRLIALPSLDVAAYMGTWYQVAWFPNRFQAQCVADTRATYRQLPNGQIEVLNRCRLVDGKIDDIVGIARPAGSVIEAGQLRPAQLEVSFLPAAVRWLPVGWGRYWVLRLANDGRYAVVSEPTRQYLWVLSRTPKLAAADESAIRSQLEQLGFDLARWQAHPQPGATETTR